MAGLHLSYDMIWDFTWVGTMPVIDALFFAGGAAYVSAFGNKFDLISAYAKVAGYFDLAKCLGEEDGSVEGEDGDKEQQLMMAAQVAILGQTRELSYEATLCAISPPCKATRVTENLHEVPLGTLELFSFKKLILVGFLPLSFEVGAQADFFIEFGIEAGGGRPEVTAAQSNFQGYKPEHVPAMGKVQGMAAPGMRAEVYGQVGISIGIASVGGGLEITVIEISIPTTAAYNFNSKKAGLSVSLEVSALGGRFYVFAEFGPCPFCVEKDWTLIEWRGLSSTTLLFSEGLCMDCETQCVYGVCDRATGTSCHCAKGWQGPACNLGCPGLLQGKPICHGRSAQIENTDGDMIDDPAEGCVYDEDAQKTSCNCRHPYFGNDCSSTFPGLLYCQWANSKCTRHTTNHGVASEEHADRVCDEKTTADTCTRVIVCMGRGDGVPTTGTCACHDGWEKDPITQSCTLACPGAERGAESCSGHGECLRQGARLYCECENGFMGTECTIACPRGGEDDLVCAGNGQCHKNPDDPETPNCVCDPGFKGVSCESVHNGPGFALDLPKDDVVEFEVPVLPDKNLQYKWTIAMWVHLPRTRLEPMSLEFAPSVSHKVPANLRLMHVGRKLYVTCGCTHGVDMQERKQALLVRLDDTEQEWNYVAVVASHGSMSVYVDGIDDDSWLRGELRAHRRAPFQFIRPVQGDDTLDIDELRIYKIPLHEADIQAGAGSLLSGAELGLELYYMFDEFEGGTLYDQAGPPAKAAFNHGRMRTVKEGLAAEGADALAKWLTAEEGRKGTGWGIGDAMDVGRAEPAFHLAPPGSTACDWGEVVSRSACKDAAARGPGDSPPTKANCEASAVSEYGHRVTAKRRLQVGSWKHVKPGCSIDSKGDWAAHWNDDAGSTTTDEFKQVRSGPFPKTPPAAADLTAMKDGDPVGKCGDGAGFGDIPIGCSILASSSAAPKAFYKSKGPNCNSARKYQLVCTGPGSPLAKMSGMVSWFSSYDAAPKWPSRIGSFVATTTAGVSRVLKGKGHGATKSLQYLSGDSGTKMKLGRIAKGGAWTICSVTRYAGATRGRILNAKGKNSLHGHHGGKSGVVHIDGQWVTATVQSPEIRRDDWLTMCSANRGKVEYANGANVATGDRAGGGANSEYYINGGDYMPNERSDWALAELITWDRALSDAEVKTVSDYLMNEIVGFRRPPSLLKPGMTVAFRGGRAKLLCSDDTSGIKCDKGANSEVKPGMVIALKGGKDNKYCADEVNTIRCNRGAIGAHEMFTVVDGGGKGNGGVRIGLRGGKSKKYCADEGGNGVKCNRGAVGGWEKFTVRMRGGKLILIGGQHNKYCADESNKITCNRGAAQGHEMFTLEVLSGGGGGGGIVGKLETFKVEDAGQGKIALKGGRANKYCTDEGSRIRCESTSIGSLNKFIASDMGGGKFALRGPNANKFCADVSGAVACDRSVAKGIETFTLQVISSPSQRRRRRLLHSGVAAMTRIYRRRQLARTILTDETSRIDTSKVPLVVETAAGVDDSSQTTPWDDSVNLLETGAKAGTKMATALSVAGGALARNLLSGRASQGLKKGWGIFCKKETHYHVRGHPHGLLEKWNKRRHILLKSVRQGNPAVKHTRETRKNAFKRYRDSHARLVLYNATVQHAIKEAKVRHDAAQAKRLAEMKKKHAKGGSRKQMWKPSEASIERASIVARKKDIRLDEDMYLNVDLAADFHFQRASITIIGPPAKTHFKVGTCRPSGEYKISQCCPGGYGQIGLEVTCNKAVQFLGSQLSNNGGAILYNASVETDRAPPGCFVADPVLSSGSGAGSPAMACFNPLTKVSKLEGTARVVCEKHVGAQAAGKKKEKPPASPRFATTLKAAAPPPTEGIPEANPGMGVALMMAAAASDAKNEADLAKKVRLDAIRDFLSEQGWVKVRHVPGRLGRWHKATDQMRGTDVYGGMREREEYSVRFADKTFDQFLFALGDMSKWVVASKEAVLGKNSGDEWYSYGSGARVATMTSISGVPAPIKWLRRQPRLRDPIVAITDIDGTALQSGGVVYAENSLSGKDKGSTGTYKHLRRHNGADVYIRTLAPEMRRFQIEAGHKFLRARGWVKVRHVPAALKKWHRATDHLAGTEVYGDPHNAAEEWSVKWAHLPVADFLFSLGDLSQWLVAAKEEVVGESYEESETRIVARSCRSASPRAAAWQNKPEVQGQPWVSLFDVTGSVPSQDWKLLYAGDSMDANKTADYMGLHGGADVWVRGNIDDTTPSLASLIGGALGTNEAELLADEKARAIAAVAAAASSDSSDDAGGAGDGPIDDGPPTSSTTAAGSESEAESESIGVAGLVVPIADTASAPKGASIRALAPAALPPTLHTDDARHVVKESDEAGKLLNHAQEEARTANAANGGYALTKNGNAGHDESPSTTAGRDVDLPAPEGMSAVRGHSSGTIGYRGDVGAGKSARAVASFKGVGTALEPRRRRLLTSASTSRGREAATTSLQASTEILAETTTSVQSTNANAEANLGRLMATRNALRARALAVAPPAMKHGFSGSLQNKKGAPQDSDQHGSDSDDDDAGFSQKDSGGTMDRVGAMGKVDMNRGQLEFILNGNTLTPTAVWEQSTDLFTTWKYELEPMQLAHLHDGENTLRLVPTGSHTQTMHVLDAFINAEVKVSNGFFNGDGANTFVAVPFDETMSEEMKSDFSVMAWVRIPAVKGPEPTVIASRGGAPDSNSSLYWALYDRGASFTTTGAVAGVTVTNIGPRGPKAKENGKPGEYFFFDAAQWQSVFEDSYDGKVIKITQTRNGTKVWEGPVTFCPKSMGVCGARSEGKTSAQWQMGDVITPEGVTPSEGVPGPRSGGFRVHWEDEDEPGAVENLNFPADRWFHLAATYDMVSLIVYVDGVMMGDTEVGQHAVAGWSDMDTPVFLGAMWDGESGYTAATEHFLGYIDDFTLWAEGRSAQQVLQDMTLSQLGKSLIVSTDDEDPSKVAELESTAGGSSQAAGLAAEGDDGNTPTPATDDANGADFNAAAEKQKDRQEDPAALDDLGTGGNATNNSTNGTAFENYMKGTKAGPRHAAVLLLMQFEDPVGSPTVNATSEATSGLGGGAGAIRVGAVHGDVAVALTLHAAEVHSWRNCPGGTADSAPAICGGMTEDASFKVRGKCDLKENPPTCLCNPGFKGEDCTIECPPAPGGLGICSGNGIGGNHGSTNGCHLHPHAETVKHSPVLLNMHPNTDAPWWCTCKTAKDGSTRFRGQYCEHTCPMSTEGTCSGHGECVVIPVIPVPGGTPSSSSGSESEEEEVVKTTVRCRCADGFFGVGCELMCPGMLDGGGSGDAKHECGGHGQCLYEHDPHNTNGYGMAGLQKKCRCNYNGGWEMYMHAGGSCVEGCPGAVASGKKGKCAMTEGGGAIEKAHTRCDRAGTIERESICNGAGLPWPLGDSVAKSLGLDKNKHFRPRGCMTRVGASPSSDVASVCLYCDDRRSKRKLLTARSRAGGGMDPSCSVSETRNGASEWHPGGTNNIDSNRKTARHGNTFSEVFSCRCPAGGRTKDAAGIRNQNMMWLVGNTMRTQCFPESSYNMYTTSYRIDYGQLRAALGATSHRCGSNPTYTTKKKKCW